MAPRTSTSKADDYHVESLHVDEKAQRLPMQDDPDAGLSDQERQQRVCYSDKPLGLLLY